MTINTKNEKSFEKIVYQNNHNKLQFKIDTINPEELPFKKQQHLDTNHFNNIHL